MPETRQKPKTPPSVLWLTEAIIRLPRAEQQKWAHAELAALKRKADAAEKLAEACRLLVIEGNDDEWPEIETLDEPSEDGYEHGLVQIFTDCRTIETARAALTEYERETTHAKP